MSAALLGLAFLARLGDPTSKLVLLKLVDRARDDGAKIFPSIATLASVTKGSAKRDVRSAAQSHSA